jgi:hypothetical protein
MAATSGFRSMFRYLWLRLSGGATRLVLCFFHVVLLIRGRGIGADTEHREGCVLCVLEIYNDTMSSGPAHGCRASMPSICPWLDRHRHQGRSAERTSRPLVLPLFKVRAFAPTRTHLFISEDLLMSSVLLAPTCCFVHEWHPCLFTGHMVSDSTSHWEGVDCTSRLKAQGM